jgi:hypothetical protein
MNWLTQLIKQIFPERAARARLEDDGTFYLGVRGAAQRERRDYNREELLGLALEAWRANPLARRIVGLTTQYVVGAGMRVRAEDPATHRFLEAFWNHRLNQFSMRIYEWCDELTRAGELFLIVSTDASGMSYARAVPAGEIEKIETAANDVQQETGYWQRAQPQPGDAGSRFWPAYNEHTDTQDIDGSFAPVMLHYAINRPVGAVRGESDLAPLLRWLSRYAAWLEDRARLNRFRNAFLYVVKGRWASESERLARQSQLAAAPPSPGSFLVVDESEEWSVISPQLESAEAAEDGLALKKIIAAGAGLPLHFLAEPESATRTTAESAGGPTYRHFEQRQEFFCWMIGDLARLAVRRRAMAGDAVQVDTQIQVSGADLSARDNAALAVAASTVIHALGELRDRALIDDAEFLRMAYRFAGEVADVEALLARGQRAGMVRDLNPEERKNGRAAPVAVDPETGAVKKVPEIA